MSLNNISPSTFTSVLISENIDSTTKTGGGAIVSAALEIQSADAGLLISRVTTEERMSMIVVNGFIVYDSTLNDFYFYSNGSWYGLSSNDAPSDATYVLKSVDANLPNAQSLGALTSGVIYNTVNAGVGTLSTCTNIVDSATTNSLFVGYGAGNSGTSEKNVGIGNNSLSLATTIGASANVAIGKFSLHALTTGSGNVAIGDQAGQTNASFSNCTFLGSNTSASVNNLVNATAIGHGAVVSENETIILGDGDAYVGIGTSDPRNELHIMGRFQQGYQGNGWTHIDAVYGQEPLQVVGPLSGEAVNIPIVPYPHSTVFISVDLAAVDITGAGSAYSTGGTTIAYYYDGSTYTAVGSIPGITLVGSGSLSGQVLAEWTAGGLLEVEVTASVTVNWVCTYKFFKCPTVTT